MQTESTPWECQAGGQLTCLYQKGPAGPPRLGEEQGTGFPRVPEKEAPADFDLRPPDYETICLLFSEAQLVTLLLC